MSKMIFVNLPVKNLAKSMAFYQALGFNNNPHFTDETAACMVWSEAINVMLLTHDKWRTFTSRPIPPPTSSEVSLALSLDSRAEVDELVRKAVAAGAAEGHDPEDLGFMYSSGFVDLDGHQWGLLYMDTSHMDTSQVPTQ